MRRGTQLFSRSLSAAIMARAPSRDRRTTSRAPVGLAPDPAATSEAVVQVYSARCSGWLGYFGVHTWIAVKAAGARAYTIYEVLDWRLRRSGSAVAIRKRAPDARWGEAVKAFIVLKPGMQCTEEELIAFCKTRLASYKKPRHVEFVAALPRNASGKVLKQHLLKTEAPLR